MWAPLLGQAAVFAALWALSTCLTASHVCPRSLDCARAGRHFCQPGSSHCGPCLRPLVENSHGRCVVKRRHVTQSAQLIKGKMSSYPELDEEIDFLSAIISEQRTETRLPVSLSQDVTEAKPKQLGEAVDDHSALIAETPARHGVLNAGLTTPTTTANTTNHTLLSDPIILPHPSNDHVFIIMSSVFVVAGSLALIMAGACWVRLQRGLQLTQKMDSPTHRLIRAQAFDNLPGDKKLAHSAQMYHYQHQKQQMLSLEKHREEPKVPDSGASTDEENEDGDFTVYECPGLAPTGEMEVKNPLFDDTPIYLHKFR
ncbi:neural proliferation differentiation and control protein 1 [Solea senegalensis]|uniref:Neural proliferation differentiation and control protein 1 n=1 Tax=Solea senegalensis TaxID=28829 RepID=A0AAV6QH76_SOLSE|nr:neural proliferation differentiation and control protein 1 [Solea senegalensis]KAG7489895.1 neural proliferation differentiation and control protein 1 [Solea senegalensis]